MVSLIFNTVNVPHFISVTFVLTCKGFSPFFLLTCQFRGETCSKVVQLKLRRKKTKVQEASLLPVWWDLLLTAVIKSLLYRILRAPWIHQRFFEKNTVVCILNFYPSCVKWLCCLHCCFFIVDSSFFGVKDPTHRYLPIKNSTLLDLSHAKDILMHKPPNVSTIMGNLTVCHVLI